MRIAALQHDIVWEDAAATCTRVSPMVAEAAAEFTLYLDREPDGRFAEQAGSILAQIQP